MKRFQVFALALVLLAGVVSTAAAAQQSAAAPKPGAVIVEVTEWSGTVAAVDYVKKTAALQGPDGKVVTVNAPNARNLDQVKVGDIVKIQYAEALAVFVRKTDWAPQAAEAQAVQLAPKGQKPGGVIVNTAEITANVEAIDYQTRMIALKGPAGNVRTVKVSDAVQRLPEVKVGDQVVVRVTEAIALEVMKP
jgi:hypothetical protein